MFSEHIIHRYPPQIVELHRCGIDFRIAMPEIALVSENSNKGLSRDRFTVFYKVRDQFFQLILGMSASNAKADPDHLFREFLAAGFPEDTLGMTTFRISSKILINSLQRWHQLTEEDPLFILKKSEIFSINNEGLGCFNPINSRKFTTPAWMAAEQDNLQFSAWIHQPRVRSIIFNRWLVSIALPKIALVHFDIYNPPYRDIEGFLCLVHTRDDRYVPLYMPNVYDIGGTCMGGKSLSVSPFDRFWNSAFTDDMIHPIRVNESLTIHSIPQWHELTQQNPNFFREQFDPIHAEQSSPIIYNIDPDQVRAYSEQQLLSGRPMTSGFSWHFH